MAHAKAQAVKIIKKHSRPRAAQGVELVRIFSVNKTKPQHVHLGGNDPDKIQFHCADGYTFNLVLHGGVFKDHPDPFLIVVDGPCLQPPEPLEIEEKVVNYIMAGYVYDTKGRNFRRTAKKTKMIGTEMMATEMMVMQAMSDPPDIIIG